MSNNSSFWFNRLKTHGHTGWADPVIYAFDQQIRLNTVDFTISKIGVKPGGALDFGCGTGDFSRLLIQRGFEVIGYDPYVIPKISASEFSYAASFADIHANDASLQLVLAVTTLDHILDHNQFIDSLKFINSKLAGNGRFIAIEYALNKEEMEKKRDQNPSSYQAFRSLSLIENCLKETGFKIDEVKNVYHPVDCPEPSYAAFQRTISARLRRRLSRIPKLGSILDGRIVKNARLLHASNNSSPYAAKASPLKLFVCSKICDA